MEKPQGNGVLPYVSGSITVSNGCQPTQKQIHSTSNWFTEEYYTLHDDV